MILKNFKEIKEIIKNNNNFKILTHVNPDGDAIGSSVGLALALTSMDKNVKVILQNPINKKYSFLVDLLEFKKTEINEDKEIIISVDVANASMLGNIEYKTIDICIDHHMSNFGFAKLNYINCTSSNTINIYYLLKELNLNIDSKISMCLYTGIITDTGNFKNSNTNEESFRIASILFSKLNDFEYLNQKLFNNNSKEFFDFKYEIFSKIKYFFDLKCSIIIITLDIISKFKVSYAELEEIPSIPLEIKSILISIVLKEIEKNIYKVSVRTKGDISAFKICDFFGGGGHDKASGFTISGEENEIVQKILSFVSLNFKK